MCYEAASQRSFQFRLQYIVISYSCNSNIVIFIKIQFSALQTCLTLQFLTSKPEEVSAFTIINLFLLSTLFANEKSRQNEKKVFFPLG